MPQNLLHRPARAVTALALTGLLTLTACEADLPQQGDAGGAGGFEGEGFDELTAPDPRGSQLSHDDMREVLEEHYSAAGVTDTDDYYASLRDIETELQKLAVDPTDCKQYVVQSASPVPEGALIAHADTSDSGGDSEESPEEEESPEDGDTGDDTDPEASASAGGFSRTTVMLPFGEQSDGDDEAGNGGGGDTDADDDDENDGEDDSDEDEPVEVDLPSDRQATVYTFQDWRAADAYFSSEENGLDSCGSYTVTRGGIGEEDEPEAETSTSVETVEIASEADSSLGIYRETETEGSTEQSVAVMLRDGSNIVVLTAPAGGDLDEEESEAAVEELEAEASAVLNDL